MTPWQRLLKASPERPTRFHDLRGKLIDRSNWSHIPLAVGDAFLQVALKRRRCLPWISYRAARDLSLLIARQWRILEFGAGMSTVWFAQRAKFVVSVESNLDWYQRVTVLLDRRGLTNVRLEYRKADSCSGYAQIAGPGTFDLAVVDGDCRDWCVETSLGLVRPGGYIYLDNTDQPQADRQRAEALLLQGPLEWHRYYNDFAPGLVAITQGMLAQVASHRDVG
jgi:predicted O-methyltransferase YrrM